MRLRDRLAALRVGQLLGLTIGVLLILAVAGIGLALAASYRLSHERSVLLDDAGPSNRAALQLEDGLVNQETGIRGYLITVESQFLQPYGKGLQEEAEAFRTLTAKARSVGPPVPAEVAAVEAAVQSWHTRFVARALAAPRTVVATKGAPDAAGKQLFDALRGQLEGLQRTLTGKDTTARSRLDAAASDLQSLLFAVGALVVVSLLGAGLVLRRTVTRPLQHVGYEARRVAGGEFQTALHAPAGPREVHELGEEIETMRERIVHELSVVEAAHDRLERQALELSRSNADLEQFAYVASHDLQEPLRKIASFCQALQTRYRGRLDERADQYIDFAVDGAKRMQVLINDLLEFSRVGRDGRRHEAVDLNDVVAATRSALAELLESTGGRIEAAALPRVRGDAPLLVSLLQNLVGNGLKFRSDQPPVVRLLAEPADDGYWLVTCEDNGIGIGAEYADRVFLIFQRLHGRDVYDGSGIGLALCRKIVEYHGGRIWLDTAFERGARFQFTLPAWEDAGT